MISTTAPICNGDGQERASTGTDAWKWTEDAFQAISYWLGYQRKRFRHYPIREIAVVTELAALLHAPAARQRLRIECERAFPLVLGAAPDAIPDYRQKRVDIAAGPASGSATHVIEVKVPGKIECHGTPSCAEDLHRLTWLKQQKPSVEVRLALVTESAIPPGWLSDSGRVLRTEQKLLDGAVFRVRRVFRALPLLPKFDGENGRLSLNRGPCVVLLEPSFEGQLFSKKDTR